MYTSNELESLSTAFDERMRQLENEVMEDIIRRIRINGEITRSADWQINRLRELGMGQKEIENRIKKALNLSDDEVKKLYSDIIESGYARDVSLYKKAGLKKLPFEKNDVLQQLIAATAAQTANEMRNLSGSLGFAVRNADGTVHFTEIGKFYQDTVDNAINGIANGVFDYNTALKKAVSALTNSGLRTVDYASGWSNRVDVAARRSVMTGISQLTGKINEQNAEELGTDMFEVTWHGGARPSHQVWQGRWYTKKQLVSVCGLGSVTGLCGANCYHDYYPVIPGISEPTYTEEQLREMNRKENIPVEYGGKQYTKYEALQRQRRLETKMRAQRQEIHLLEVGGASEDDIIAARCRYRVTSGEYTRFSKAMELPQQRERVTIDGLGNVGVGKWKKSDNTIKSSIDSNNAVKKLKSKESNLFESKSKANTGRDNVAISGERDIIEDVKQLSLNNLTEFENWQESYYKANEGVSFSREDNPTIYRYTGGDYDIINALERGGEQLEKVKRGYGERYVESLKGCGDRLSEELSKFKLDTPLMLKRSVGKVDYITGATSSVEDMKKMIGKTFTEKGFTSTTICSDAQLPFGGYNESTRTTLEIIAPKGTKGAYVYKISDSPAEFEFLIDKNTTYEVVDAGEREILVKDYKGNESKKTERYMVLKVIKQ